MRVPALVSNPVIAPTTSASLWSAAVELAQRPSTITAASVAKAREELVRERMRQPQREDAHSRRPVGRRTPNPLRLRMEMNTGGGRTGEDAGV